MSALPEDDLESLAPTPYEELPSWEPARPAEPPGDLTARQVLCDLLIGIGPTCSAMGAWASAFYMREVALSLGLWLELAAFFGILGASSELLGRVTLAEGLNDHQRKQMYERSLKTTMYGWASFGVFWYVLLTPTLCLTLLPACMTIAALASVRSGIREAGRDATEFAPFIQIATGGLAGIFTLGAAYLFVSAENVSFFSRPSDSHHLLNIAHAALDVPANLESLAWYANTYSSPLLAGLCMAGGLVVLSPLIQLEFFERLIGKLG